MKKTISINISGILFHIEEDGYATLKKYLESINRHFSHYADNQEIISDIENRIAEIFLSNLKNNKQVITADNVNSLIEKMGTIADFKAIEEELDDASTDKKEETQEEYDYYKHITPNENTKGYKKLTRLENRKILGGVCAGMANYLSIDPLWTRLVAILLIFSGNLKLGSPGWDFLPWNFNFSLSFGFFAIIAYIVLWVILPVSYDEPEDKNIKKLYRNPDDKTLGGVASGLAAYFGIEVIWMRLLFIGLIFAGGSGFVIYIILWIITPVAKSITERIEMKGGAITLDNIETTIRENQNPIMPREESQARKILLAPFRFLGKIINALGEALGPLGSFLLAVIRVFFGLVIFIIGMAITIAPLALLGVYFGIAPGNDVYLGLRESIPMEWITEIVPVWLAISASVVLLVPGIIIVLLGISVLIKKSIIDAKFGLVALGIWLLSIGFCAFQIPRVVATFKSEATHTVEQPLTFAPGTIVLKSVENDSADGIFDQIKLQLDGTDASEPILLQHFEARGKNKADALKNAQSIKYIYTIADSTVTFQRSINLNELDKFRVQNLRLNLEIPYDRAFVMDKSIIPIIQNTIHRNGYKTRDINSRNHWVFNENGLLCLTCNDAGKTTSADSLSRVKFEEAYFMK
ncbi:PspC domain-containing protein [Aquiflexum sp. LQ15W]|uniref:PspC domain-containing protein n=1 Tax=Cognataquiflexum nitidum TaxID=2922272 RepID=UPI001F130F89|nr:PspC domain-containing protein [Cognataquiflexum nitidum]MCH6199460.1 PspC domain-containing protein [Cognataquiflexum nitidum]